MNARNLPLSLAGALALAAGPAAAQTAPTTPPSQVVPPAQPDADAQPGALPNVAAPKAPGTPDWTFEEVLGGEVTVGQQYSPVAMGIGAIAGVVAFNVLQQYVAPNTNLLAQTVLAESDLAASRIYTVGSAVAGALAGQFVYEQTSDAP
jgi:hypothetical protein